MGDTSTVNALLTLRASKAVTSSNEKLLIYYQPASRIIPLFTAATLTVTISGFPQAQVCDWARVVNSYELSRDQLDLPYSRYPEYVDIGLCLEFLLCPAIAMSFCSE